MSDAKNNKYCTINIDEFRGVEKHNEKNQGASEQRQATSDKRQATSDKRQATSDKRQATSS